MKTSKLIQMVLLVLAFALTFVFPLRADVLLSEDFNNGTVPNNWVFQSGATGLSNSGLEEISSGDYAAFTDGPKSNQFEEVWHSYWGYLTPFERGDNLRVTFKVWATMDGYHVWGGAYSTMCGPWHSVRIDGSPYQNIEAGVSQSGFNPGNFTNDPTNTGGPNWTGDNASPYLPYSWSWDWNAADSKGNAITMRIWLGDTKGCRIEYQNAGSSEWILLGDTREVWGGSNSTLYLGYSTPAGKVNVDDIVVENGGTAPELPNTDFMGALFYEDFSNWTPLAFLYPEGHGPQYALDQGAGNFAKVEDVGGGDMAFYTNNGNVELNWRNNQWQQWVYSVDNHKTYSFTFSRGNNLRCTFTAWGDPSKPNSGGPSDPEITWPDTSAINGPFMYPNNWNQTHHNIEAGIGYEAQNGMRLIQKNWDNTEGNPAGTDMSGTTNQGVTFADAWTAAVDKAHAVHFRVTLGDTMGAMNEWSLDGETWTVVDDTREVSGASDASGIYIGWSTNTAAVFIDDIAVEDDINQLSGLISVIPVSRWTLY